MKKKINAFTLIELLIVISIISIISFGSMNGFLNFMQKKETDIKLMELNNHIISLDKKIKNHEIFDYEISFLSNTKNEYFVNQNIFDTKQYQKLDYQNGYGKLTLSGGDGENWNTKVYKDLKLIKNISHLSSLDIDFESNYNYKIFGTLYGSSNLTNLNIIEIYRLDKENNELSIIKISKSKEKKEDIGNLKIVNIGGKKQFYNSGTSINEAFIYFENKGNESFLKLTK